MYNNTGGQSGPSKGIRFSFLTPSDQTKFEQIFTQSSAAFGGNKISANAVSELLRRSNLDNDSLAKIWDLSSISNSPFLSFPEFAVAMFLTSKKLTGQVLPASLPPNIREETEIAMATIASTESQQLVNTQQFNGMQPQQTGINQQTGMGQPMSSQQTGMMGSQQTGMMGSQQIGMMGSQPINSQQTGMMGSRLINSQQTGMMGSHQMVAPQQTGILASQQLNMMTGMTNNRPTPPPIPQLPMQTGYGNYGAPMQSFMPPAQQAPKPRLQNLDFAKKMMPNQNGVTNLLHPSLGTSDADRLSWKISPQDKQRYRDIFNAWEGSGSGFMSGDTAKDVLTQSQLPPQDLMKIWNLADSENRGSLDVDEFSIAMHLVYRKLNGFEIPNVLPAELKPPSSLLKKFVLGRRPPPSTPSFNTSPQQEDYNLDHHHQNDYVSSSRRKGPQSASSKYASQYNDSDDQVDVVILEDLRRQISETKRELDRIPVIRASSTSSKYSLEELKERIRRAQDDLSRTSNPLTAKYNDNSDTLLDLLETEKSLQDEIQYLCNRDIPVLARQLRGAAAELRDTKVRHSRKSDGTQDFMAFIQPTGPGGSVTESDRVRAKAKAMMAARKAGNNGSSTDAAYSLRRAEEEKEEADRKADTIEREMEKSRTALLDMRGDLRYLEEMTAAQDLEDKKRFETGSQDLSYELRRFIEQLNSKASEPSTYAPRQAYSPSTSGYQSSSASPLVTSTPSASPKPKTAPARPRTAEEIKKEAERRVQERLAALQAKRNPNSSPRSVSKPSTPSLSKPDESESIAEREAQDLLRNSVHQREQTDRKNREAELERLRESERDNENLRERQRLQDLEAEKSRQQNEEDEKRREEEEERDFQERRRQVLAKEEANRQARFDAIKREEEEAERKKQEQQKEHKPEEAPVVSTPPVVPAAPAPPAPPAPPPAHIAPTPPPASVAPALPPVASSSSTSSAPTSSNNPFAKLQQTTASPIGSSQAEKPNEPASKRVSYNPFATFSAFSATKGGSKDDSDSEDDGWDVNHDDSDDENEFPAAGSAKNLAGMLFSAMSQRENTGSLETVREVSSPKPNVNDLHNTAIPPPPPAPPAPTSDDIPPPPPAPVTQSTGDIPPPPPPAPTAPSAFTAPPPSVAGGDARNALLGQIQSGLKLKKAKTNDRSASSIAGHVIGDAPEPDFKPSSAPVEIEAPTPIAAPLASGDFLAELQSRTLSETAIPVFNPEPASPVVDSAPKHDESLPEHEYVALWDYPGSGADDLVFSQDDVILIRDDNDAEDWWFGTLEKNKKTGYFPRNYVQLKPEAEADLNIKAKTLYDFEGPEGQGCLSFKMGDVVTILVKENDDWWKAQSEDGTQVGLVPANYLEQI